VGGLRLGVALPARLGQAHVDAPAVHVAHGPLHQTVLLEPADQTGQGALAQVHGLGEFLNAELVLVILGQPLKHLVFADTEPMPLTQFVLERGADRGMARGQGTPGGYERRHLVTGRASLGHTLRCARFGQARSRVLGAHGAESSARRGCMQMD
jgi:hypothetical protein